MLSTPANIVDIHYSIPMGIPLVRSWYAETADLNLAVVLCS